MDESFDLRIKEYCPPLSLELHSFGLVTRAPCSNAPSIINFYLKIVEAFFFFFFERERK